MLEVFVTLFNTLIYPIGINLVRLIFQVSRDKLRKLHNVEPIIMVAVRAVGCLKQNGQIESTILRERINFLLKVMIILSGGRQVVLQ